MGIANSDKDWPTELQVTTSPNGVLSAVWIYQGNKTEIHASIYTNETWGPVEIVSEIPSGIYPYKLRTHAHKNGNIVALWNTDDSKYILGIKAAERKDGYWSETYELKKYGILSDLASDHAGNIMATLLAWKTNKYTLESAVYSGSGWEDSKSIYSEGDFRNSWPAYITKDADGCMRATWVERSQGTTTTIIRSSKYENN